MCFGNTCLSFEQHLSPFIIESKPLSTCFQQQSRPQLKCNRRIFPAWDTIEKQSRMHREYFHEIPYCRKLYLTTKWQELLLQKGLNRQNEMWIWIGKGQIFRAMYVLEVHGSQQTFRKPKVFWLLCAPLPLAKNPSPHLATLSVSV